MASVQACKYLLSCRAGYREHTIGFEPADGLKESGETAREIIARKLEQIALRNAEIEAARRLQ